MLFGKRNRWRVSSICMIISLLSGFSILAGTICKQTLHEVHLQFCKNIFKVRNSTPKFLAYGEIGRFPLDTIVKQKSILFWNSLLTGSNKMSHIMYKLMLKIHETRPLKFKWIYTKSI